MERNLGENWRFGRNFQNLKTRMVTGFLGPLSSSHFLIFRVIPVMITSIHVSMCYYIKSDELIILHQNQKVNTQIQSF